MKRLLRCVAVLLGLSAAACRVFPEHSQVTLYEDGPFIVCYPTGWTVERQEANVNLTGLNVRFDSKTVVAFVKYPAQRADKLAEFQLATRIAQNFGIRGTPRERPRITVFGGAEGNRLFLRDVTTPQGEADLVDVYAMLKHNTVYVAIAVVADEDAVTETVLEDWRSIVDWVRFTDVEQFDHYRRGPEDCSNDEDERVEGVWYTSRDWQNTTVYSFDDGAFTATILSPRRGEYSAVGGRLRLAYSDGQRVACGYTIADKLMTLHNCNADFPTIFQRR
jgi:hypothetical protein